MRQKVDVNITFCKFLEKLLHFHLLYALKQVFSVTVFSLLLPSLIYFSFIDSQNIFKLFLSYLLSYLGMKISY